MTISSWILLGSMVLVLAVNIITIFRLKSPDAQTLVTQALEDFSAEIIKNFTTHPAPNIYTKEPDGVLRRLTTGEANALIQQYASGFAIVPKEEEKADE